MKDGTTYSTTKPRKLLVIGDSGTGKTCFTMNLPNPYYIDWDGNLATAIQLHPDKKFTYDSVEVDEAGKPVLLDKQWERGEALLRANGARPEVGFIVDDGLSRMADLLQAYLVRVGGEAEKILTVGGIKVMNRSLWQPFAAHIRNHLRLATSFNKPYVLTCHTKVDQNELTEIKELAINISGQIVGELVSWFTDFMMMTTEPVAVSPTNPVGVSYVLLTSPTLRIKLKNSMGLPPKIRIASDSPELKAMLSKLGAGGTNLPVGNDSGKAPPSATEQAANVAASGVAATK